MARKLKPSRTSRLIRRRPRRAKQLRRMIPPKRKTVRTRPKKIQRKQRPKRARKRRQRSSPLGDGGLASAGRNWTLSQPCTRSSTPIVIGEASRGLRQRPHGYALRRSAYIATRKRTVVGLSSIFPCWSSPANTRRRASCMAGSSNTSPLRAAASPRSTRRSARRPQAAPA